MSTTANKQVLCEALMERAESDDKIVVLCSDSRGSASMTPFAEKYPQRFVEVGIAEQNLVSIAAGMAACGMKSFAVSPASFLSARSYEQIKVDVAYSNTNVKLIGVSGGISYGALGMTHHSCQDIAALAALPNMRVYIPSDAALTRRLINALLEDERPAYIRVSRGTSPTVYAEGANFVLDQAITLREGHDVTVIACGELVAPALAAAAILETRGISCRVLDMYCIKPLDTAAIVKAARETRGIITVEEHSTLCGLGALTAQAVATCHPTVVRTMAIGDEFPYTGTQAQAFAHYGLNAEGIAQTAMEMLKL